MNPLEVIEQQIRKKFPKTMNDTIEPLLKKNIDFCQNFYIFTNLGKTFAAQTISDLEAGKLDLVIFQLVDRYQAAGINNKWGYRELKLREVARDTILKFGDNDFKI